MLSRGSVFEAPCHLLRTQFADREELRAWYMAGTVFSCRAHIENCGAIPAQLQGVQLFGLDSRYLGFHVLLRNPHDRNNVS